MKGTTALKVVQYFPIKFALYSQLILTLVFSTSTNFRQFWKCYTVVDSNGSITVDLLVLSEKKLDVAN